MVELHPFKTPEALVRQTVTLLRETLPTPGNLMLSGGSTPYLAYAQLAAIPCPVHPDRKLFLSDERMVPADSPHNNAKNLAPLLKALKCNNRFIRIDTRLPIHEATNRFARNLQPLRKIDLGLLGIGSDGHTAGIFTPRQARQKTGNLALHASRPDGMQGVSVAPALFERVERIILLVAGESKRKVIDILLNKPETIPVGIALVDHPRVELWTDLNL